MNYSAQNIENIYDCLLKSNKYYKYQFVSTKIYRQHFCYLPTQPPTPLAEWHKITYLVLTYRKTLISQTINLTFTIVDHVITARPHTCFHYEATHDDTFVLNVEAVAVYYTK